MKFEDVQHKIKEVLEEKTKDMSFIKDDTWHLINGFIDVGFRDALKSPMNHSYIPLIGLIGASSGLIHLFALSEILPEEFEGMKSLNIVIP